MLSIIDYGAGNLQSVKKAFDYLNVKNTIINSPDELKTSEKIVLPGVGSFGSAMKNLKESGLIESIREYLESGKPYLGICLGMQLLFEHSTESKGIQGLGVIKGKCKKFKNCKVPQIGWNKVKKTGNSEILHKTEDNSFFYFLHSYYVAPEESKIIKGISDYRVKYPSVIEKDNVFAVQFHPEKSGKNGLKLLKNWEKKC